MRDMASAGEVIREARERQGITAERLSIRSGVDSALLIDAERGARHLSTEQLADVLLVCGLRLEQSGDRLAVRPLPMDHVDLEDLRELRAQSPAERLTGALGWNTFADRVLSAGRRARQR